MAQRDPEVPEIRRLLGDVETERLGMRHARDVTLPATELRGAVVARFDEMTRAEWRARSGR